MIGFPNCKINLGLKVIGKRHDGYHDLETVFYPVPIKEALEIISADDNAAASPRQNNHDVKFAVTGLDIPGETNQNLCIKAYRLLVKDYPRMTSIQMHLHKKIPAGAGLGGGSADGAFALRLLNQVFDLNLTTDQLIGYALQLGSDCPFFIINKPSFARGRGELLEEIALDLSGYRFVLVNPGIHVNTGWAFSQLSFSRSGKSERLNDTVKMPVQSWRHLLSNDFEVPVSEAYPEIKFIRDELYKAGAVYAAMTGSGSTVFGIFNKGDHVPAQFPPHYKVMVT